MKKCLIPFSINWQYTCYQCNCPLNVSVDLKYSEENRQISEFFKHISTWAYYKPTFHLVNNVSIYKIYGSVVQRVCYECYDTPCKIDLRKRETGQMYHRPKKNIYSKTKDEIYEWFSRFDEFRKRGDLESFIVKPSKYRDIRGLKYLLFSNADWF